MPANNVGQIVKMSGFNETISCLKKLGGVVSAKVVQQAMGEGPMPFLAAAKANARRMKNKRRKGGKHLYQSIGKRLKVYKKNGVVFVAAGGLYREGGYHAHLVELGHRIVRGGTLERGSQISGITAAGKRWLGQHGLQLGYYEFQHGKSQLLSSRVRGKLVKSPAMQYIGKRAWLGMKPGNWYKRPGNTFMGRSVRGGGELTGKVVPPHPFMKPAWEQTKRSVLYAIEQGISMRLVDQCVKLALEERALGK